MSNAIYNVVVSIINEVTGIDPGMISTDSHIVDDLQIDSFAATEILTRFEEEFNITINTYDFIGVYIISDIVDTLESLGATVDENNDNVETIADTTDTAYLSTQDDIFGNGSKKVLTYKSMLDLMYDENKFFKAQSIINTSIAPYSTEKFVSSGSAQTTYSTDSDSFTINTGATNYKTFNAGLTHFISTATMTITMSICLQFAQPINATSTDEDETSYNIAKASLDFDNDGTQTASVEDTGVAYIDDNTAANTPAVMNAGNNSRARIDTSPCETGISCNLGEITVECYADGSTCSLTPTMSVLVGACETTVACNSDATVQCWEETINCENVAETSAACELRSGCQGEIVASCSEIDYYNISYKATVYPNKSSTAIATVTATARVSDIFSPYYFPKTYIKIPIKQYFEKYSTGAGLAFGFHIDITISTDYTGDYSDYTIANSTITYNRPTYYVFNPNDKTVRYTTANTLYSTYTQS